MMLSAAPATRRICTDGSPAVLLFISMASLPLWFPVAVRPMHPPRTLFDEPPSMNTPSSPFAEITLCPPFDALSLPIWLDEPATYTPKPPLPSALSPVVSVPMKLSNTALSSVQRSMPSPTFAAIVFPCDRSPICVPVPCETSIPEPPFGCATMPLESSPIQFWSMTLPSAPGSSMSMPSAPLAEMTLP